MHKITYTTLSYLLLISISLRLETISFAKSNNQELVNVNYQDEDLIDVINQLAEAKEINVILPVGEDFIQEKVTFSLKHDISLKEAWELLYLILEVAGYSMIEKTSDQYTIVRTSPTVATEPLPLYVGTPSEQLPDIEKQIRYIYFLSNLKLDDNDENNEIVKILKEILPEMARVITNNDTNSIIIVDTARNIKSALQIIQALDQSEFKEEYKVLPLRYVSAEVIADIFKEILGTSQPHRYRLDTRKKSEVSYFSRHLKIIGEPRTNALILLGRRQAIDRVTNFISNYIDIELEEGSSILHVYQLQYLDANKFAEVLQKIVGSTTSASGQARGIMSVDTVERFFEGVIVKADTTTDEEPSLEETGLGEYKYYGGNKIIVAAKQEDWTRIRRLIEQLDTPQPQVIIEVLIADLSLDDTRVLASILRNPQEMAFPQDANFQSAQASATLQNDSGNNFTTGIIVDNNTDPTTIAADLLRTGVGAGANSSIANGFPVGTTLVSFNDRNTGQTWGLLELRKLFGNNKILSNPHVIATNNQQAEIVIGQQRLLIDQASGSEAGTTQVTRKWIPANLILKITPRISSANTVNLNVEIKIDRFEDPSATNFNPADSQSDINGVNNIDNRWVYTNANIHSTDILALGGLTRVDFQKAVNRTPLLGRIPILGYFFKDRNNNTRKTNLTIFISPTIVPIRLRGGISKYTEEYIDKSRTILQESTLFESLQDPITRFFFGATIATDPIDEIERFVSKDEFKQPEKQYNDIRELATINIDTADNTPDDAEDEKQECCSRATRIKQLVENEDSSLI